MWLFQYVLESHFISNQLSDEYFHSTTESNVNIPLSLKLKVKTNYSSRDIFQIILIFKVDVNLNFPSYTQNMYQSRVAQYL